ncbi:hypothetical protein BX667DRAFT_508377 [Coemansia mojavensis]|nr:hypothetical protein BX667DRAFT_508377 [Coemansia mojavensis]
MGKPGKKTPDARGLAVINIRAVPSKNSTSSGANSSSSSSSLSLKMEHPNLSKKSSTILTSERQAKTDEMKASSLPSESMYRFALRSAIKPSGLASSTSKDKAVLSLLFNRPEKQQKNSKESKGSGSVLWLNIHYVQGDKRKRISFPPKMLVSQARDLCMLRFGVWQEVMKREESRTGTFQSDDAQSTSSKHSTSDHSTSSSKSTRELYGLYRPDHAQWLNPNDLLSAYQLASGDKLELQDHNAFISTPAFWRNAAESQEATSTVEGEGQMYYMQTKGLSTAWRLCWVELSGTVLGCYRQRRLAKSKQRSTREHPLVLIDLSGGFKLVDQHGRQNQRISTSDQLPTGESSASSILGLASYQHLGGNGAPLIIKCSDNSVHIFCTQSAVDYDYWRRMLRLVQTTHELPTTITASSENSCSSSVSSYYSGMAETAPEEPQQSAISSSSSSAAATSLVHRPQQRKAAAHIVARPKLDARFSDTVVVCSRALPSSYAQQQRTFCVLVPHMLYGFASECQEASADAASIGDSADFSVDLHGTRLYYDCEQREPNAFAFVISILRVSETSKGNKGEKEQGEILLSFEASSHDKCMRWIEALRSIGGIGESQEAKGSPKEDAPSLRRSRSFISTISRADWPLPPATLPLPRLQPSSSFAHPLSSRLRGMSMATSDSSSAQFSLADEAIGNPSLDAVGMRMEMSDSESSKSMQQSKKQSRFPWFRRNLLKPSGSAGSTGSGSAGSGSDQS